MTSNAPGSRRRKQRTKRTFSPDGTRVARRDGARSTPRLTASNDRHHESGEMQPQQGVMEILKDPASTIVSRKLDRKTGVVSFEIRLNGRATTVTEFEFQTHAPLKLLQYYGGFGKLREETLRYNKYRVFQILNHKTAGKGRQLLVHWVGYPATEATWEPERVPRESDSNIVEAYLRMSGTEPTAGVSEQSNKQIDKASQNHPEVCILLKDVAESTARRIREIVEEEFPGVDCSVHKKIA